jgi:hypothetical protein
MGEGGGVDGGVERRAIYCSISFSMEFEFIYG